MKRGLGRILCLEIGLVSEGLFWMALQDFKWAHAWTLECKGVVVLFCM